MMPLRHNVTRSLRRNSSHSAIQLAAVEAMEARQLLSGTISGRVFNDLLASGKGGADPGMAGVTVFIDANKNGTLDAGELSALTNAQGAWKITGLTPGAYTVVDQIPSGFSATTATSQIVHLKNNHAVAKPFGMTNKVIITGTVFNDVNGDGIQESGDAGMRGQIVFNDINGDGRLDGNEKAVRTRANGVYRVVVNPGTVKLALMQKSHYSLITPLDGHHVATLAGGQTLTLQNFAMHKGSIPSGNGSGTGSNSGGSTTGTGGSTSSSGGSTSSSGGSTTSSGGSATGGSTSGSTGGSTTGSGSSGSGSTGTGSSGTGSSGTGSGGSSTGGSGTGTGGTGSGGSGTSSSGSGSSGTGGTGTGGTGTGGTGTGGTGTGGTGSGGTTTSSTGDYIVTATRSSYAAIAGYDVVKFYALDTETGQLAGSNGLVYTEQTTLSCASGLIIRADTSSGTADFDGSMFNYSASYVGFGRGFNAIQSTPSASGTYTDYQSVTQFQVVGGKFGGVSAATGSGVLFAVAVVPHNASVTVDAMIGADVGPVESFTYTA